MHQEGKIYKTMWIHGYTVKKQMQKNNRLWCYQNLILVSLCLQSSPSPLQTTLLILILQDLGNRMGRGSFRSLHPGVPTEVSQTIRSIPMLESHVSWERNIIVHHHCHRQQLESTPLCAAELCHWTEPGTPGSWRCLSGHSWWEETSLTHSCSLSSCSSTPQGDIHPSPQLYL